MTDSPPDTERPSTAQDESAHPLSANPKVRPGIITSRNNITTCANRLIAEYTLTRYQNNSEVDLVYIKLDVPTLFSTYANTLKPIVFGNFRNIGARTITDQSDKTFLDNVVRTVATNAVICTYAVAFNKAASIDAGAVTKFGDFNPVDANRFPALTTLLVSSLGPLEANHLPYKCTFVPYFQHAEVNNLINQTGYSPSYYESFLQAMKRGRTINMSDVDVHTKESSPWWTLYMDNLRPTTAGTRTTPGHITAYNPNSFDERNPAILLASMVLEDTLYPLPGPLIVATIGPFASMREPTTVDDIPDMFMGPNHVNKHVPALFVKFTQGDQLTHATALTFGEYQKDREIAKLSDLPTDNPAAKPPPQKRTKSASATPESEVITNVPYADDTVSTRREVALYTATVIYFDHIIAYKVPHNRRANIVTDANKSD